MQKIKQYLASLLLGVLVLTPFAQVAQAFDVSVIYPKDGEYYKDSVRPTFSASGGAKVTATLNRFSDNTSKDHKSGTWVTEEGTYGLVVTGTSGSQVVFDDVVFSIDKTAPTIDIYNVANGGVYSENVRPSFSASDNMTTPTVSATLNGNSCNGTSCDWITQNGTYALKVYAHDVAGNETWESLVFTVDKDSNGKDGKDGEDGQDGADGEDGTGGTNGTDGEDGEDGTDGQNGTDGTSTVSYINRYISNGYSGTSVARAEEKIADQEVDEANYLTDLGIISIESDTCSTDVNACENVRIIGKAKQGLLVILYLQREGDDTPIIGFVRARAGNIFEFVTDEPLEAGEYNVYAKAAEEGGKTGPIILLDTFEVEGCSWWVAWLWILLILILIVLGFLLGMYLRRRNNEFDEFEELENQQPEVPEMPQSRL